MNFLWPQNLWLLVALPLLVLLYLWLMKRKRKTALRYASLSIVKEAMGASQSFKRHIPPLLFLFSIAAMLLAAARPVAVVTLPSNQQTIILAMDVSGSMRATDVQPNRLVAAQNAAKAFIAELPRHVKVGIVAFAGSAQVAQLPTVNREDLVTAIDRFQLQRATATGNAIVISLATLFPDAGIDLQSMQSGRDRQRGFSLDAEKKEKKEFTPVAPGSYTSAAIIMLTDGQRTTGVDPLEAAKIALLVLLYLWLMKRKRKTALRYASLSIVKEAMGASQSFKRHIPPLLFLFSIAAMLLAAARPVAVVTLPSNQQTIILAMDVSGSMRATDVQPNRLVAAQNAAKAFIAELPRHVKVGIVAFAGSAQVAQLPTVNREDLVTAIDRFQLQRATATGNAIVISLATLFPDAGIDLQSMQGGRDRQRGFSLDAEKKEKKEFTPVAPGSYTSAAIIMLTDGQRTTGVDPLEAAKIAAERGVRVYTVGIGTVDGETIGFEGWSMRVRLDEETLKAIAQKTSAEYYYAGTAGDLKKVYETLSSRLTVEKKETEVSALLAMAAAVLALLSAGLSLLWFNRIL